LHLPEAITFETVQAGGTSTSAVEVYNSGTGAAVIRFEASEPFYIPPDAVEIPAEDVLEILVFFSPESAAEYTGDLRAISSRRTWSAALVGTASGD
jgi:hypothetical protein